MILVDADHAGALLLELRETMRTIPELPDGLRPRDLDEAYAIQDALHVAGAWDVGALKVGCTSLAAQEALGVHEPIGGRVPTGALFGDGVTLPLADFHHQPLLECEFALRVAREIPSDTPADDLPPARTLVDAVAPAIELVDSRFHDMLGASGLSLVADNAVNAAVVLGKPVAVPEVPDLASIAVSARQGATVVADGDGSAVLGDPYLAVAWAVRHELGRGRGIPAGTWISTGTCTGLVRVPLGASVHASFGHIGEVAVTVGPG